MDIQYVKSTDAKAIDPSDVQHHVPSRHVYIGVAATATMQEIKDGAKPEDVAKFQQDCKNFLIEAINQIKRRFDVDSDIFCLLECILPGNASALLPPSLSQVLTKFPFLKEIDSTKLDLEWRAHSFEDKIAPNLQWTEYWLLIKNAKYPSGEPRYPMLLKFIEILASYPFSNAAVERVFSMLKLVKTDHRSSLKASSLVSLLQCKMAMKNNNLKSASVKPSSLALKLATKLKSSATDEEAQKLKKTFLEQSFS